MKAKKKAKLDLVDEDTLIVGVDVGKKKHYCRFINLRGYEIGKVFSFKNNRDGMEKVVDKIEKAKAKNNLAKVVIGIEPSGHYWKPAVYYLKARGYPVALVNPCHVKRLKELEDNCQTKTDIKDCLLVAKLVKDGNYFNPNLCSGIYAELRRLSRLRLKIKKTYVREKTKLRSLLDEYFPEYEGIFYDLLGKASTYVIKNYFLPEKLARADTLKLAAALAKVSRGKVKKSKALKLITSAKSSIGITEGRDAAILEKDYTLGQIDDLKKKLNKITKKMISLLKSIGPSKYLLSIPGVGPITAAGFIGEVGDIEKYSSSKEVIKLAGLNLYEISSGMHKGKKRISKRGNRFLRVTLYQCAVVAVAKNPQIRRYFKNRSKNKNKMKVLVAVQAKLARIMFALLKGKKYYDPKEVERNAVASVAA